MRKQLPCWFVNSRITDLRIENKKRQINETNSLLIIKITDCAIRVQQQRSLPVTFPYQMRFVFRGLPLTHCVNKKQILPFISASCKPENKEQMHFPALWDEGVISCWFYSNKRNDCQFPYKMRCVVPIKVTVHYSNLLPLHRCRK